MIDWQPIDENTPKDRVILVWYDHAADPYIADEATDMLTPYGMWCEGGDYRHGTGFCAARWCEDEWASTDVYGNGCWMPGWWFEHDHDERYERAVNPTHWADVQEPAP